MPKIAGVATRRNTRGQLSHITIDVKKHPEAIPVLKSIGLVEKSKFELECEQAISVEECFNEVRAFINGLPWKK